MEELVREITDAQTAIYHASVKVHKAHRRSGEEGEILAEITLLEIAKELREIEGKINALASSAETGRFFPGELCHN